MASRVCSAAIGCPGGAERCDWWRPLPGGAEPLYKRSPRREPGPVGAAGVRRRRGAGGAAAGLQQGCKVAGLQDCKIARLQASRQALLSLRSRGSLGKSPCVAQLPRTPKKKKRRRLACGAGPSHAVLCDAAGRGADGSGGGGESQRRGLPPSGEFFFCTPRGPPKNGGSPTTPSDLPHSMAPRCNCTPGSPASSPSSHACFFGHAWGSPFPGPPEHT